MLDFNDQKSTSRKLCMHDAPIRCRLRRAGQVGRGTVVGSRSDGPQKRGADSIGSEPALSGRILAARCSTTTHGQRRIES
jgi:hypothetical protein